MKVLTVRPAWAWLIVQGYKPLENRTWKTNYRGPILVHASKAKRAVDYKYVVDWLKASPALSGLVDVLPPLAELPAGGVVGQTTIVDCIQNSDSPWFMDQGNAFVLSNSMPLPFHPCKGALQLFELPWPPAVATHSES